MGMLVEKTKPRKNLISLTPLIDVVFILLLFFMLSSSFTKTRQFELRASSQEISAQASAAKANKSEFVKVIVKDSQHVLLNGRRLLIGSPEMVEAFAVIAREEQPVVVAASLGVDVQHLIMTLDFIKGAGVINLSLAPSVATEAGV